jgi:hypothetical protein
MEIARELTVGVKNICPGGFRINDFTIHLSASLREAFAI